MRNLTIISLIVPILSWGQFNNKTAESEIKEVTVFVNGAQITRNSEVTTKVGYNRISYENLSPFILEKSIQTTAIGGMQIISVNFEIDYHEELKGTDELTSLREESKVLLGKMTKNLAEQRVIRNHHNMILHNQSVKSNAANLNVEDMMDLSDFYDDVLTKLMSRKTKLQAEYDVLKDKYNNIVNELRTQTSALQKSTGTLEITVYTPKQMKGDLGFSYVVSNAGWYPVYDIRSKDLNSDVGLNYKAQVYQQCGEDWKDVKLKLSTGDPNKSNNPPGLGKWYVSLQDYSSYEYKKQQAYNSYQYNGLNYRNNLIAAPGGGQNNYTYMWTSTKNSLDSLERVYLPSNDRNQMLQGDINNVGLAQQVQEVQLYKDGLDSYSGSYVVANQSAAKYYNNELAEVSYSSSGRRLKRKSLISKIEDNKFVETRVNTNFDISIPYTIPSDGKLYMVEIGNFKLPAKYEYYCAPRQENDAFLVAKVTDWDKFELIPGEASIYFQGTFVGKTYIDANTTLDTLELSLGRDKNIKVERRLMKDFTQKTVIGRKRKATKGQEIRIRNGKSTTIELVLVDQIPVANQKNLDVELLESSGASFDEETGKLTWRLTIQPSETKVLNFKYQIIYPKDSRLNNF